MASDASLVALDRAVALPTGAMLLGGRALRLLDPSAVRDLDAALPALLDPSVVFRVARCLDRWGNGPRDVDELSRVLHSGVARALDTRSSLLLIGCVVP